MYSYLRPHLTSMAVITGDGCCKERNGSSCFLVRLLQQRSKNWCDSLLGGEVAREERSPLDNKWYFKCLICFSRC